MADRHEALREDEAAFHDLQAAVTGLDEARMKEVWLGVWGVREILAHVSGWHRAMVPAFERIARGEAPFPAGVSYDDYDAWNARFAAAKAHAATAEILTELDDAHRAFVTAASGLSDDQLAKGGAAHDLFRGVGPGHYPEHTAQIRAWRGQA